MAACNGPCEDFTPGDQKVWFKIYESGYHNFSSTTKRSTANEDGNNRLRARDLGSSLGWDQYTLANNGWSLRIPKHLRPGNYLIRHEIIMIELFPPQHYPECAQLTVTGEGDMFPSDEYLVSFPGAYSYDGMCFVFFPLFSSLLFFFFLA